MTKQATTNQFLSKSLVKFSIQVWKQSHVHINMSGVNVNSKDDSGPV